MNLPLRDPRFNGRSWPEKSDKHIEKVSGGHEPNGLTIALRMNDQLQSSGDEVIQTVRESYLTESENDSDHDYDNKPTSIGEIVRRIRTLSNQMDHCEVS